MRQEKLDRHRTVENSRLNTAVEDTFSSTCAIHRVTRTENGIGGFTETWAALSTKPVPCAFNAASGEEAVTLDTVQGKTVYTLHLPPLTDIKREDRVVIGTRTFEVNEILNPVSVEVARTCRVTWLEGS